MTKKSTKNTKKFAAEKSIQILQQMMLCLKEAYLKKDFLVLQKLYPLYEEYEKIQKSHEKGSPYLFMIARLLYIANSPLTGYLQLTKSS